MTTAAINGNSNIQASNVEVLPTASGTPKVTGLAERLAVVLAGEDNPLVPSAVTVARGKSTVKVKKFGGETAEEIRTRLKEANDGISRKQLDALVFDCLTGKRKPCNVIALASMHADMERGVIFHKSEETKNGKVKYFGEDCPEVKPVAVIPAGPSAAETAAVAEAAELKKQLAAVNAQLELLLAKQAGK